MKTIIVISAILLGGCQHNPNFGNNLARDPMFNMGMQMLQQQNQQQYRPARMTSCIRTYNGGYNCNHY